MGIGGHGSTGRPAPDRNLAMGLVRVTLGTYSSVEYAHHNETQEQGT